MQTIIFDIFFLYRARAFPTKWKMANVVPIYKQGGKDNVNNYGPVSLLPIISERLIYNEMYLFFI